MYLCNPHSGPHRWRIWYRARVVTSGEMAWGDAPREGVQVIGEVLCDGRAKLHFGMDYFRYKDGCVYTRPENLAGAPSGADKAGRRIPDNEWAAILAQAYEWAQSQQVRR